MKKLIFATSIVLVCVLLISVGPIKALADGPAPVVPPDLSPVLVTPDSSPAGGAVGSQAVPGGKGSPDVNPQASGGISITKAWTTWGDGETRSKFNRGDSIHFLGTVSNTTGSSRTAAFVWSLSGPCGSYTLWSGNLTVASGTSTWTLGTSVASNACAGNYTLTVSETYSGVKSTTTYTFSVAVQSRTLVFPISGNWTICQGMNTSELDHVGNMKYSLDFSPDPKSASGTWGCNVNSGAPSANGTSVVAPAAGTLTQVLKDLVNFQLDSGGCLQIGHFSSRVANGHYNQGVKIGTLGVVSGGTSGGYPHLHLTATSSNSCNFSTPVGFEEISNFHFSGAMNFPATSVTHGYYKCTVSQVMSGCTPPLP